MAVATMLVLSSHVSAQYDVDPELRIQQLEQQLRTLTGQNEELQHRNLVLEQQLRQFICLYAAGYGYNTCDS